LNFFLFFFIPSIQNKVSYTTTTDWPRKSNILTDYRR
jgi:hypothetical protein